MVVITTIEESIVVTTSNKSQLTFPKKIETQGEEGPIVTEHKLVLENGMWRIKKEHYPKFSSRKEISFPYSVGIQVCEIINLWP